MSSEKQKIGLIGIGAVGQPLSQVLIEQGFDVVGHKRSDMSIFEKAGGIPAPSPRAMAEQCDVILSCLPHNQAVKDTTFGKDGILASGRKGLVIIDLNTLRPLEKEETREKVEQSGSVMLDAPFSGTPGMVAARRAVMFVSGDKATYENIRHIFDAMSEKVFFLGGFGTGTKMKMIANSLVGIHIVATAEAMSMALKADMDPEQVIEMLIPSAAGSFQFQVRAPIIKNRAFMPALATSELLDKDLETICGFADDIGATAPLTRKAAEYVARTRDTDLAHQDCAAVFDVIAEEIGLKI